MIATPSGDNTVAVSPGNCYQIWGYLAKLNACNLKSAFHKKFTPKRDKADLEINRKSSTSRSLVLMNIAKLSSQRFQRHSIALDANINIIIIRTCMGYTLTGD